MSPNKRHKTEKTRDTKRKRHRSRSRSYSPEREKPEKHSSRHHKKHKKKEPKERKDYDSDVEIVSAPPPPKISRNSHLPTPPPPEISREHPKSNREEASPPKGASSQGSLSIEETNRLRAKLGLKPLEVEASQSKEDPNKLKDDLGEFYHKPATNINDIIKTQKIKEKITLHRQKRQIEADLARVKLLGERKDKEDDSDDDAKAWVEKNRRLQNEKKKADARAKMLDQMDEEFGIGELLKEEEEIDRRSAYTEKDLRGLRVEHDIGNFADGQTVILTLKDKGVLDEENDVLVNVNIMDDERYKKSVVNKTKKPGYDAYDEDNFDEFGMSKGKILDKYDEEIDGEKKDSFSLGIDNAKELLKNRTAMIKNRLANKKLESLKLPEPKLASEYYNDAELVKFKKPKKMRKIMRKHKMLKADDLVPDSTDYLRDLGSRRNRKETDKKPKEEPEDIMDADDYETPSDDVSGMKIEEDDKELEFQIAMRKAQRLKQPRTSSINTVAATIKQEGENSEDNLSGNITLNATAEFCRTLGDIPTYGLAGNREENDQEMMDFEVDGAEEEASIDGEEGDGRGAWNSVQLAEKAAIEPVAMESSILDVEPSLGQGVGGALRLAMSKGYLQKEDTNRPSASRFAHLQAQNYSIEDKTYGDDDKFGRRDRFNGPTSDFKERDGFKPNVKLEYIDDDGHVLCAKEAFRYLSHKFHGKGPGKNKVEKRMKKVEQEVLMKRMSSTDTPLGTLNLLQAKQKETQSPYIVLSGSKQMQTTSISKSKH